MGERCVASVPALEKGNALPLKLKSAVAVAVIAPTLAVPAAAGAATVIGSGSSAEQPILTALFAGYHKLHPKINFVYTADGGNAGVKDVQSGTSQFAVNTRAPLPSDAGTLQAKLYLDGLCVAVNKANKLTNLSLSRTANVFEGVFTNWGQVGGSGLSTTIDPIGRDSAAGSYTFFQQAVLNGQTQASNVEQLSSDGLVATAIKHDRNAIGYVGLAHSGKGSGVKAIKLNGKACSPTNIKSEKYPLSRFIWGVLPLHNASQPASQFFDWVRTSAKAGTIIAKSGAVPAFNKKAK
jgi:phosphate transport system substrate-binding protein